MSCKAIVSGACRKRSQYFHKSNVQISILSGEISSTECVSVQAVGSGGNKNHFSQTQKNDDVSGEKVYTVEVVCGYFVLT